MGYYNKDLADIGFKIYTPNPVLEPYIYNYWSIQTQKPNTLCNKILSDGSLGFILNFASTFDIEVNQQRFACKEVTLTGQTQYPTFMHFKQILDAIGIRFKAGGAYIFFDEPLTQFCNKNMNALNELKWSFDALYRDMISCKNNAQRIQCIERFLIQRLQKSTKQAHLKMPSILHYIQTQQGDITMEELGYKFDLSVRSIERMFKRQLGLSAKVYARIIRMRNARDILSSLSVNTLTQVGYESGFFDQAHFIKEFRHFMFETPKNYFERRHNMIKQHHYKKF